MELGPNQKALVAALRSGEYQQDKGYLRTINGFCCLGVAEDVRDSKQWVESTVAAVFKLKAGGRLSLSQEGCAHYKMQHDGELVHPSLLNEETRKKIETLVKKELNWVEPNGFSALSTINDEGGDFNFIADLLETGAYFLESA